MGSASCSPAARRRGRTRHRRARHPGRPAKVRLLGSTKASKNDPNDALSTAIAGLRHCGLRQVVADDPGISRSLAYQEARAYVLTTGRAGIPTIKIGCRYVVPAAALQRYLTIAVPDHGLGGDATPPAA